MLEERLLEKAKPRFTDTIGETLGESYRAQERMVKIKRENILFTLAGQIIENVVWPVCDFFGGVNRATKPSSNLTMWQRGRQVIGERLKRNGK